MPLNWGSIGTNLISSVGGALLGGAASKLFGSNAPSQRELMQWQEDMMREQFKFQSDEAEKNRQFQSDEAETARNWNSIISQLERARAAGVNPYSLVSQGSYGSATGAIAPAGAMAGPANIPNPPANTALQGSQSFNAVAGALERITAGVANIANARKVGVDTEYLERSMNDLLAKIKSDANFADLRNSFQSIVNKYADKKQQAQINEIMANIGNLDASANLSTAQIEQVKSTCTKLLADAKFTNTQEEQLRRFLDKYFDAYQKSVIDLNKANQNAADASAYKSTQEGNLAIHQAGLVDAQKGLTEEQTNLTKVNTQLSSINLQIKKATSNKEKAYLLENYTQLAEQSGLMTSLMKEKLEEAKRNNDWATVEKICGTIQSLSESFKNVGIGVSALSGAAKQAPPVKVIGFH